MIVRPRTFAAAITPGRFLSLAAIILIAGSHCCADHNLGCAEISCDNDWGLSCPDDYSAKPLPCQRCPAMSCCRDDYCPTPIPCLVAPQLTCCPGNYCAKPLPCLHWRPLPVWYSCGVPSTYPASNH